MLKVEPTLLKAVELNLKCGNDTILKPEPAPFINVCEPTPESGSQNSLKCEPK